MIQVLKFGQWLNILVFCRTVCRWTWPLESCARVELWSSSRLVYIHPWNESSLTLCRFCFELLPHKASWLPRAPTLFGEKMLSFMPRSWFIIYVLIFLHLLVQIPRELPEINEFSSLPSSHWCEDREATIWGLSSWLISLGRRQSNRVGARGNQDALWGVVLSKTYTMSMTIHSRGE